METRSDFLTLARPPQIPGNQATQAKNHPHIDSYLTAESRLTSGQSEGCQF